MTGLMHGRDNKIISHRGDVEEGENGLAFR